MFIRLLRRSMQKFANCYCDYCRLSMPPSDTIWCSKCLNLMPKKPRCQQCGLHTEHATDCCGECLTHPPQWDRLFCISDYSEPLSEYVHRLKYSQHFWLAYDIGILLSQRISDPAPLIIPVPLHWKRFWWRSYNQSDLLAWAIEKQLNHKNNITRCDTKIIKRTKATRPQKGLSRAFRQTNLLGAFKVVKPIKEKHVAIVDDVVTTGATINLLCAELRAAGVEKIDVYAVCRTGRN